MTTLQLDAISDMPDDPRAPIKVSSSALIMSIEPLLTSTQGSKPSFGSNHAWYFITHRDFVVGIDHNTALCVVKAQLPNLFSALMMIHLLQGAPQSQQKPSRKRMSPSLVKGSPSLVNGSPNLVNGSPSLVTGSPSPVNGSSSLVNGSPNLVHGPPSHQPERTTLNLRTALGLYNLTDSELFWELQLDTRCLMGWSDSTIVVAFRGTASIKNALSDLQVSVCMPVCLIL